MHLEGYVYRTPTAEIALMTAIASLRSETTMKAHPLVLLLPH